MECSRANELMMQYMDGTLSEANAAKLRKHIDHCEACSADFAVYDEIVGAFEICDETPAPDGFVEAVMTKVSALESVSVKAAGKADNILLTVWGIFTVLLGLGFALVLNREAISVFLAEQPALAVYMDTLAPIGVLVGDFVSGFATAAEALWVQTGAFLNGAKYFILGIAACLALTQVVLSLRERSASRVMSRAGGRRGDS